MPRYPLHDIGKFGLISDIKGHELPPEALYDGRNIRMQDNYVTNFQSYREVGGTKLHSTKKLFYVPFAGEKYWLYANETDVGVWKTSANTHHALTRASGDYTMTSNDQWNGFWLNGVWIMNNGVDKPQFWADGNVATKLADLTNWPATWKAKVLRGYKNFALAMDITKSSTRYKSLISWSHPADPGAVPSSWDITDPTKLTGDISLAQTSGQIVDACTLREANIIYKTDAIIMQQYVGGNDIFAWREISNITGAMGQQCAVEFQPGQHLVLTSDGDVVLMNGQTLVSVASRRILYAIRSEVSLNVANKSFLVAYPERKEVWVCFVNSYGIGEEPYVSSAFVWNWESGAWGRSPTLFAFDAASGVLEEDPTSPTDSERLKGTILAANVDGETWYQHDVSSYAGGVADASYFTTQALSFGGQKQDGSPAVDFNQHKVLTEIWPNVEISGAEVLVSIKAADEAEYLTLSTNYQDFVWVPSESPKIDCCIDGKYFQIEFFFYPAGELVEYFYKLFGFRFEFNLSGEYP